MRLLPDDPYFLYYPFRFGYINKSEHQSIHAFEGDIEILWKTVIANKLKIRPEDFEVCLYWVLISLLAHF